MLKNAWSAMNAKDRATSMAVAWLGLMSITFLFYLPIERWVGLVDESTGVWWGALLKFLVVLTLVATVTVVFNTGLLPIIQGIWSWLRELAMDPDRQFLLGITASAVAVSIFDVVFFGMGASLTGVNNVWILIVQHFIGTVLFLFGTAVGLSKIKNSTSEHKGAAIMKVVGAILLVLGMFTGYMLFQGIQSIVFTKAFFAERVFNTIPNPVYWKEVKLIGLEFDIGLRFVLSTLFGTIWALLGFALLVVGFIVGGHSSPQKSKQEKQTHKPANSSSAFQAPKGTLTLEEMRAQQKKKA